MAPPRPAPPRRCPTHGRYNSWDRIPYITTYGTGKPSVIPAWRHIRHNFIVSVYSSQEAIDTDDGSAYYKTYENFFVFAANGLKSDFAGHVFVDGWGARLLAWGLGDVGNQLTARGGAVYSVALLKGLGLL